MTLGGVKARPSLGFHETLEVKLPKARIVLNWVTLLALDFQCTLPPMVHPILSGGIQVH